MFPCPMHPHDPLPFQRGSNQARRRLERLLTRPNPDRINRVARDTLVQSAHNRLDLRKLRHPVRIQDRCRSLLALKLLAFSFQLLAKSQRLRTAFPGCSSTARFGMLERTHQVPPLFLFLSPFTNGAASVFDPRGGLTVAHIPSGV